MSKYYRHYKYVGKDPIEQAIEDLQNDVEIINTKIANANHHEHFMVTPRGTSSPTVYYLNATTGNDTNDGLTPATAKQHLYNVLELLNKEKTAIYVTFTDTTDTVYDAVNPTSENQRIYMSGVTLAITNYTNHKISIVWGDSVLWNNSYLYAYGTATSPIEFRYNKGGYPSFSGDYRGHFDNTMINWSYVTDLGWDTGFHSCKVTLSACAVNRLYCETSNLRSTGGLTILNENTYIEHTESESFGIKVNDGSTAFFGTINVHKLKNSQHAADIPDANKSRYAIIHVHGSHVGFSGDVSMVGTQSGKYAYGLTCAYSTIYCPQARLDSIASYSFEELNGLGITGALVYGAVMNNVVTSSSILP